MKRAVIYVAGLGDQRNMGQRVAVALWRLYGVRSEVVLMRWLIAEPFTTKLVRITQRIDSLHDVGYQVSLVGVSAGASAVVNAYAERPQLIHRVVCVCGKLRNSETIHPRTYQLNPAFGESMQLLPASLGHVEHSRILSIRPLSDETVPPADTIIHGAREAVIRTHGHTLSIAMAITIYSRTILRFIKQR